MSSRVALLALAVGLVLADSSVVTLGLPAVLSDFDASPEGVSWVLTGYNLTLALAAVPAARLIGARWNAARVAFAGLVVFAVASAWCAIAPSLGVLIAARLVQGVGGAAVACAALPLLSSALGSLPRGAAVWGAAGAFGAAVGPAAGGLLTDLLSWEAIFVVQVPLALLCLLAARETAGAAVPPGAGRLWAPAAAEPDLTAEPWTRAGDDPARGRSSGGGDALDARFTRDLSAGRWSREAPSPREAAPAAEPGPRPDVRLLAALAFLGAGLTAALFLLVLLLIAGWRHDPLTAAAAVSVMPVAALIANRAGRRIDARTSGAVGAVLVAGGLAALGLLPSASLTWTVAPQVLIGVGLGLSLGPLTEAALQGRRDQALHGGWTLAARHLGVVAALALLTPIFTADLERADDRAQESVLAHILDSRIAPTTKLALGLELADRLDAADGEVPDPGPAFDAASPPPEDAAAFARLRDEVDEELDRAATSAFERSFLVAAGLALLALVPLVVPGGQPRWAPAPEGARA